MTKQKLAMAVFFVFLVWSGYLSIGYNYFDFIKAALSNGPSLQVATDLGIALSMILIVIYQDAKRSDRRFWPYMIITLFLGSFGPLLYLILSPIKVEKPFHEFI